MRLKINHKTVFEYPYEVATSVNEAWLRPLTDEQQSCLSFNLTTVPASDPRPYTDYYGNTVYHFDIQQPHSQLEIVATADVLTEAVDATNVLYRDVSPLEPLSAVEQDMWYDFLSETPLTKAGAEIRAFTQPISEGRTTVASLVLAISNSIYEILRYEAGITRETTTADEVFQLRAGVCQDYTHLFIACARMLGVPARYVSGYLCIGSGEEQVHIAHAWPEVLLPSVGWVGVDVSNGRPADDRYVRVAVGRDYADVPLIRRTFPRPPGTTDDEQDAQQQQQ